MIYRWITGRDSSQAEINRQAAQWLETLIALDANLEGLRPGFYNWLAVSPRHLRAFRATFNRFRKKRLIGSSALIIIRRLLDGVPGDQTPSDHMANKVTPFRGRSKQAPLEEEPVRPHEYPASSLLRTKRPKLALGVCVTLVLVIGAALALSVWPTRWITYQTQLGEQKIVPLPDGTVMRLNTLTILHVRISDTEREVRLVQGEVLFQVSHDVDRPFRVQTPDARLQDIGTAFDAYVHGDSTRVSVTEGQIDAWRLTALSWLPWHWNTNAPTRLAAGDVAEFSALRRGGPEVTHPPAPDLQCKLSWTDGHLCFHGESLGEAAAEFNRYNARQIVVTPELQSQRVGGLFRTDGTDSFIDSVKRTSSRKVAAYPDRDGDTDIVRLEAGH